MGGAQGHHWSVWYGCKRYATGSSGVLRCMSKLLIILICCSAILLQSCSRITHQSIQEIKHGPFKVVVRTQELNSSGSYNVDICVANDLSQEFPAKKYQCFLNGYEFDGLTVKWRSSNVIEVYFKSGRVSHFTNSAFVYPHGPVPEEFHILLCDGCAIDK